MLSSPIRYAGGKRWLAKYLAADIEAVKPTAYFEPFLGGGAVALAIDPSIPKVLSDINGTLIDMWRCLAKYPTTLINELVRVCRYYGNDQDGYLRARTEMNTIILDVRPLSIRRAALFLYLNARCFNGLWRTNSQGLFNVPYGKLENPSSIDLAEAIELKDFLYQCQVEQGDYIEVIQRNGRWLNGSAIYADPPYHKMFSDYAKEDFNDEDQTVLAAALRGYVSGGAKIWTTNNDTPLIRDLYRWASIEEIEEHHSIGATGDRRGRRKCLLIRGG